MIRKFAPWTKTECDDCGNEFLVTRTEPKTVEDGVKVLCNECEMYYKGYKDCLIDVREKCKELLEHIDNLEQGIM